MQFPLCKTGDLVLQTSSKMPIWRSCRRRKCENSWRRSLDATWPTGRSRLYNCTILAKLTGPCIKWYLNLLISREQKQVLGGFIAAAHLWCRFSGASCWSLSLAGMATAASSGDTCWAIYFTLGQSHESTGTDTLTSRIHQECCLCACWNCSHPTGGVVQQ